MDFVIAHPKALPDQLAHPGRSPQFCGVAGRLRLCQQGRLQLLQLPGLELRPLARGSLALQPFLPLGSPNPMPTVHAAGPGSQAPRHLGLVHAGGKQLRRLQTPPLERLQIPRSLPDDAFHAWLLPCPELSCP